MNRASTRKATLFALIVLPSVLLTGCDPTEEGAVITGLQSALTSLSQNRSLTEQFVRDVKANVDPGDPAYGQAMESYQEAKEQYNRYLDQVESGTKGSASRSLRQATSSEVQNSTADFLADATRALRPNVSTRGIKFQRAVVIPDDLARDISAVPKKQRERMIDHFDDQVRWRSWSEM